MKKLILTLAIVSQAMFVFAAKPKLVFKVKNENVKMYLQAGTASPVLKALTNSADIEFIRKFDQNWSLVVVDEQPGYVLTSELYTDVVDVPYVKGNKSKKFNLANK